MGRPDRYAGRNRTMKEFGETISSAEIVSVIAKISVQAGSRPYYDVVLVTTKGKQIPTGRWIRNKREAEWLAATMKEELGLLSRRSEVPAGHDPRHVLG